MGQFSVGLNIGANEAGIATGMAYQLSWNLVALANLHRATCRTDLRLAVDRPWASIREHHLSLGGGPWGGVGHRSREVFNTTGTLFPQAYVETCSTLAWTQLNHELLAIANDLRYADEIKCAAYNDLLGALAGRTVGRPGRAPAEQALQLIAYFSPSWTAFQADRGRDFSVIVDGVSN